MRGGPKRSDRAASEEPPRPLQGRWCVPRFVLALLLLAVVARPARAHDFRPAVLSMVEAGAAGDPETRDDDGAEVPTPGRYLIHWTPPRSASTDDEKIAPVFPEHCRVSPGYIDCGEAGLSGTLAFTGLAGSNVEVVVQIRETGGQARTEVLGGARPELSLDEDGQAVIGGATGQLAWAYTAIGVEHILLGFDHLMFVLGLVLLVGFRRDLVWTITAFTVAHSITLACSVLGLFTLPGPPVEATIALSILLVAAEATHERPTLTRRAPWLVSFGFGLIHGFGFSGALQEIGLPEGQVPLALLCFNLGVELGQLLAVLVLFALWRALGRLKRTGKLAEAQLTRARTALVYAMGGLAAYWFIDRVWGLIGLGG